MMDGILTNAARVITDISIGVSVRAGTFGFLGYLILDSDFVVRIASAVIASIGVLTQNSHTRLS